MTNMPTQNPSSADSQGSISPAEDVTSHKKSIFDPHTIRNRQRYLLWGIGSCLVGGMVIYGWVALREPSYERKQELKNSITTGSSRINPQEAWMYQFRSEAELTKKRLDTMEDILKRILKIHEPSKASVSDSQEPHNTSSPSLNDPAKAIQDVRQEIKYAQNDDNPIVSSQNTNQPPSAQNDDPTFVAKTILPPPPGQNPETSAPPPIDESRRSIQSTMKSTSTFRSKAVRKISLSLRNARSNIPLKTFDNTIPAGAFAKAILLGGVDASASISASSDPRPALLRIMDPGTLPRKFHSDLMDCHVLAACYGDISSERVYMRLEKLTCTERKTGEIVEIKVQGYVAGEDGRTGVRGSVVDRAGESMRNAMMGGFIGGIGEFLSQSRSAVTFSPIAGLAQTGSLTQVNPMGVGEMLKHGAGSGASSALSRYADFYIKRAEQLQPVIQVAAGRQVDVVFTEGVSLNESLYRQTLGRSNDQGRFSQIQSLNEDATSQKNVSDWIPNAESKNREPER